MRLKILLLFVFMAAVGVLNAQTDTTAAKSLVISEVRMTSQHSFYIEFTNMGTDTLELSNYETGRIGAWTKPWNADGGSSFMLPQKKLAPGASYVIAKMSDYVHKMWALKPDLFDRYQNKVEFFTLADLQVHVGEAPYKVPQSLDSISTYAGYVGTWGGRDCFYLRWHYLNSLSQKDSLVVDQVGGVFDESDGTNKAQSYDVAGVSGATGNNTLVRKFSVKTGNTDFANGRGNSYSNSEWIPLPLQSVDWDMNRALFWTVKNHGDYHLSDLTSSTVTVDNVNKTITVPWGTRDDDAVMNQFTKVPGIAWHYSYSTATNTDDSAYVSARTGDKLILFACGNALEVDTFTIIATPSKASDALVIPKKVPNYPVVGGNGVKATLFNYNGAGAFCDVTEGLTMDTIRAIDEKGWFNYGTRVDTLLKYLEKPTGATITITYVDGIERPDLKAGDILTVKSADGTNSKQYYIRPHRYFPSHDAYLSSITWPDIPADYRGLLGWDGDTISAWASSKFQYQVHVPWDVDGTPALVGKKEQVNSKLSVAKALNLTGTVSDRTTTFTNVAEDDTTVKTYTIEMVKDVDPSLVQHWYGDPFISQYVWHQNWGNTLIEIVNPGTDVLDLSNYMLAGGYYATTADGISQVSGTGDWANRYKKYIFGYKWQDQTSWQTVPAIAEKDPNITPLLIPGDVFVLAHVGDVSGTDLGPTKSICKAIDLNFLHNPWGEDISGWAQDLLNDWWGTKVCLYKIKNDSILKYGAITGQGSKPAINPNDFEVIDAMGMADGSQWVIGGVKIDQVKEYFRKPTIYKGNPVLGASFKGLTQDNDSCEWIMKDETWYQAHGYGWPAFRIMVADGIGSHFMNTPTQYKSYISSVYYKPSKGCSLSETLTGVGQNVTYSTFLTNIIKQDPDQHLKVVKVADGTVLPDDGIVSEGDTLVVVSKDSINTTKYKISLVLLSNDAVLTSSTYTVDYSGNTGSVGGFANGTLLKDVVAGVTVPAGASMIVVDGSGAYQSLKVLMADTTYSDVVANSTMKFIVTAEDAKTIITYSLAPTTNVTDAYVFSDAYTVDNSIGLIGKIPSGVSVAALVSNLVPSTGASFKLYDTKGNERTFGNVAFDDYVVVTAADNQTTKTYYLAFLVADQKYLDYVNSDVYVVSQDPSAYKISYTNDTISKFTTTVDALIAKLIPAPYATVQVLNASGSVKSGSDLMEVGDKVRVTSGNGVYWRDYTVIVYTENKTVITNALQFMVGPNPALVNSVIKVAGVDAGSKIAVYNVLGSLVSEKLARSNNEEITLSQEGVYFVNVSSNGKKVTTKLVVK